MRWVAVRGSHFEIGQQLGRLAADAFTELLPRIERYREVQTLWAGSAYLAELASVGKREHPAFMREIEGIADGAGVSFETAFAWNCRGDFPGGGDQSALAGCSDVMALRPDGQVAFMAHNEDDQPELDGACYIVSVEPDDGAHFTSFYSPGLLPGHTFAWNAFGLVQTINHLRTHDQQVGLPRHLLCRAVLDCRDIDAALALIEGARRAGAFHHNLGECTAQPRVVSVEAPASGLVVLPVDSAHVHANHLVRAPLKDVEQTVTASSASRQACAARLVSDGIESSEQVRSVLSDTSDTDYPICRRARTGPDTGFTLAASVFTLTAQSLEWAIFGDPREAPLYTGSVSVEAS